VSNSRKEKRIGGELNAYKEEVSSKEEGRDEEKEVSRQARETKPRNSRGFFVLG